MKQRALRGTRGYRGVSRVDVNAPGQGRRCAKQFLIDVIAHAPDRLRQEQTWCERIRRVKKADLLLTSADPEADGACEDGAKDCDAALPDGKYFPEVGSLEKVVGRMCDHVVKPCTDDADRYGPQRDRERRTARKPAAMQPPAHDNDCDGHTRHDE